MSFNIKCVMQCLQETSVAYVIVRMIAGLQ